MRLVLANLDGEPGQVVVLFQPGALPVTDAAAESQVARTLAAAGVAAEVVTRLDDPNGVVLNLTGTQASQSTHSSGWM